MDTSGVINGLSHIPTIGWIVCLVLGLMIIAVIAALVGVLFFVLKNKNIKTRYFDCTTPEKKELYMAEGKDQLDNQCHVAKQLLKELRIKLFCIGREKFKLNETDQIILELITYRIVDRLNYDMKNDLTRNHITKKNDNDLISYSDAKAEAYFMQIKDRLFMLNSNLRAYDLPLIMDEIPESWFKDLYRKIYFKCRDIAGSKNNSEGTTK